MSSATYEELWHKQGIAGYDKKCCGFGSKMSKNRAEKVRFSARFFTVFKADAPFCLYVAEFMLKG